LKITKRQLRRIIREEKQKILREEEWTASDQAGAEEYERNEAYLDWMHKQLAPKAVDILAMLLDRKHAPFTSEEMAEIINDGTWNSAIDLGESLLDAFNIDYEREQLVNSGQLGPDEEW